METAGKNKLPYLGEITAMLRMGKFSGRIRRFLLDVFDSYDIILGDPWFTQHKAVLNYETKVLSFKKGTRRFEIKPVEAPQQQVAAAGTPKPLTAIQVKRLLRKGKNVFLGIVHPV